MAPGSSTAVVDDEKVLYANVKETQVAETEFKAPTNEGTKSNFWFLADDCGLKSGILTKIEVVVCVLFTPSWNVL